MCTRDVAVTRRGLVYRHDPRGGRDPELRSCPGSLKPVQAPAGALLLFVSPNDDPSVSKILRTPPEPTGLF